MSSSLGLIFLKLGSRSGAPVSFVDSKLSLNLTPYVIAGLMLYGFSFVVYTYLISQNDLGYIVPVSTALIYIFIFSASFLIFKEAFTVARIMGIVLIFGGLVLLNLHK